MAKIGEWIALLATAGFTGLMVWEKCHGIALFGGNIATLEAVVIGAGCIITALWVVCVCNTVIIGDKEMRYSALETHTAVEVSLSNEKTKKINELTAYIYRLKVELNNSEYRHRLLVKSLSREENRQKWERFQAKGKAKVVSK